MSSYRKWKILIGSFKDLMTQVISVYTFRRFFTFQLPIVQIKVVSKLLHDLKFLNTNVCEIFKSNRKVIWSVRALFEIMKLHHCYKN